MPLAAITRRRALVSLGAIVSGSLCAGESDLIAPPSDMPDPAPDPRLQPFDDLMMSFLAEEQIPGASLAVGRGDRLVYARGFGLANLLNDEPVRAGSLFRIASISKPITAVVVLRLVERGELALGDLVCERLELKDTTDSRWSQVTLLHLLQHTGGWDRDASYDPMFRSVEIAEEFGTVPPAGPAEVIRYMQMQPLDFDPGTKYAYSNFGYCLLGRVIERVTGLSYADAVARELFTPLGISRIALGATLTTAPGEVRYYADGDARAPSVFPPVGELVPEPYGAWNLEAMDAHGGWIASAVDLVRFASAFHDFDHSPLLNRASIDVMTAIPEGRAGHDEDGSVKVPYYGCGWSVRAAGGEGGVNIWHQGALDGTSTLLVRRYDGLSWAVLFNRRLGTDAKNLASLIDSRIHEAAAAVAEWPEVDLFPHYLQLAEGT
jgi:CubicO group peptidase (beta-lactamase class C family)